MTRGEVSLDRDMEGAEKVVAELRAAALTEVRSEREWDGVLALVEAAPSPDQVGFVVAVSATAGDEARVLPALLTDSRKGMAAFAKGYVWARMQRDGWAWVKKLSFKKWSDAEVLEFALALPSEKEAWDLVLKRGAKAGAEYWRRVPQFCFSKAAEDVTRAATMLTKAGRPFAAVRQLGMARHRGGVKIASATIISVLEAGREVLSDEEQVRALGQVRYDLNNLIGDLQKRVEAGESGLDVNKVASLEWTYLDLLDGHPTVPKTLHTWLASDPNFLVQLLTILFRRSDEPAGEGSNIEPSESARSRAVQVYRLLNSWHRVPGSRPDGSVDGDVLRAWVKDVQRLSEAEARREMGDLKIGNVFAYAPTEEDGSWPCIPVRDAIEEFGTEALADGFEVGIMNKRGAYSKALDEGGGQERALAKQYFDWADALKIEWPKTAASLRRVGERYEVDARREDAEAGAR